MINLHQYTVLCSSLSTYINTLFYVMMINLHQYTVLCSSLSTYINTLFYVMMINLHQYTALCSSLSTYLNTMSYIYNGLHPLVHCPMFTMVYVHQNCLVFNMVCVHQNIVLCSSPSTFIRTIFYVHLRLSASIQYTVLCPSLCTSEHCTMPSTNINTLSYVHHYVHLNTVYNAIYKHQYTVIHSSTSAYICKLPNAHHNQCMKAQCPMFISTLPYAQNGL